MKNLVYTLILIAGLCSCSHSRIVITDSELPEEVFYLNDQIKPFTGVCQIYYTGTKIIKEEMSYEKGILDGAFLSYYPDGSLKRKGTFVNGQMHGKWESWYKNGMKRYIANYSNDELSGEYLEWFENGVVKEKGLFAENIRAGEWTTYDEAGMILKKENRN
jgi:antitoxin component YwqK of YwqJK toxin-antitoxin module